MKDIDAKLIRRCLEGDKLAFETLVDRYEKIVFNAAYRIVADYDDARDITQNIFLKIYQNLDRYDPNRKFFSWLYRMTINEAINFVNRQKKSEELSPELISWEKNPEENLEEARLNEQIQHALMKIEVNYRIVIVLRHFMDCSYREIGYILEIPEKTVKSRLYSARQMLKEILEEEGMVP